VLSAVRWPILAGKNASRVGRGCCRSSRFRADPTSIPNRETSGGSRQPEFKLGPAGCPANRYRRSGRSRKPAKCQEKIPFLVNDRLERAGTWRKKKPSTGVPGAPQRSPAAELIAPVLPTTLSAPAPVIMGPKQWPGLHLQAWPTSATTPTEPITERKVLPELRPLGSIGFVKQMGPAAAGGHLLLCSETVAGETP